MKPALMESSKILLDEKAVAAFGRIPLSNDTIIRRQNEMGEQIEASLIKMLQNTKFSLPLDIIIMYNQAILMVYVNDLNHYFNGLF